MPWWWLVTETLVARPKPFLGFSAIWERTQTQRLQWIMIRDSAHARENHFLPCLPAWMPSRRLATPCRGGNLNLPLQVTSLLLPSLSSLPEPYQCATVVLQCSCSSLPLQCSQSPVPYFLPACQSPFPIPACTPSTSLPSPPLLQPSSRAGPLSLLSRPGSPPTPPRLVLITPTHNS